MSRMNHHIVFPKKLDEHEGPFKELVNGLALHSGHLTVAGGDYGINRFSAEKISDINNVWYWHDKMHPCHLQ